MQAKISVLIDLSHKSHVKAPRLLAMEQPVDKYNKSKCEFFCEHL